MEGSSQISGRFKLDQVSYRYPGAIDEALKDISLEIEAGESLGIVGRVGSGKTTLLKHLVRLLDVQSGSIELDGHALRDYPLPQLRKGVVQVLQDPFLFGEPLGDNITYDDPGREAALIWNASEAAALKDTILSLADGLNTLVGERGVTLSGGQKQRATLARGLIRDADVLILDDCFSAVDTETEEHILGRLRGSAVIKQPSWLVIECLP